MDGRLKGYVYTIIASLLTGIGFVLSTIVVRNVSIESAAFFMFATGLVASTLILIATRKLGQTGRMIKKYWKPVLAIGILNAVSLFLWLNSLKLIGPSLTAFLARFGTVFTIIMGVAFLKERFNRLEAVGAAIMIIGAFVLSYNGGDFVVMGVILVLILSLTFSTWQFLTKIYLKKMDPLVLNHIRIMFTFAIIAPYILFSGSLRIPPLDIMGLIVFGSIVGGVIGFLLGYRALQITDLSKVSTIQALDPFIIMVYSFIILGSIPTGYQLLGGLVIVAGTLLLVMSRYRPKFVERFFE